MDEKIRKIILEGSVGRALLALSMPIILGNLLQTGYQLTDAFWVGRLGAPAVAAVAVSFPVTFLVIALGSGLAMAGAVLIAQYAGAGRQDMVDHVAGQTMMMVLLTSTVLGAAAYLLAPDLLTLLGVAPDVRAGAVGFMQVSFVDVVFVFTYAMFQALMRGIGRTRLPLLIVLGTVLLNFALDPLFIFGWGPLPGAGVVGAAMATVVTQALAAAVGMAILLQGRQGIHLKWENLRPNPAYIRKAFLLGLPGSIELSTRALGLMVMSFLVASFGTLPTAVYGVGSTIIQVVTVPAMGLSWRCPLSSVRTSEPARPGERRRSLASAPSADSGRFRHWGSSRSQWLAGWSPSSCLLTRTSLPAAPNSSGSWPPVALSGPTSRRASAAP